MKPIEYKVEKFEHYIGQYELQKFFDKMSEEGWIYKECLGKHDGYPMYLFYKFDAQFLQYNREVTEYIKHE